MCVCVYVRLCVGACVGEGWGGGCTRVGACVLPKIKSIFLHINFEQLQSRSLLGIISFSFLEDISVKNKLIYVQ